MSTTDQVVEALKEWLSVSNPGFVTKEDLARVEERLDELGEIVDEIAAKVTTASGRRPPPDQ